MPERELIEHLAAFARALRKAGVPVDASKIALGIEAIGCVGIEAREDVGAALEAVMVGREEDREIFRALFHAWFSAADSQDPPVAQGPTCAVASAEPPLQRRRLRDALPEWSRDRSSPLVEHRVKFDGPMVASDRERLRHSDFATLDAGEYRQVQRLAREIALALPTVRQRRDETTPGAGGTCRIDWLRAAREAVRTGGELVRLPRTQRRRRVPPLVVIVDVSGSMERYARVLLAFLHAAIRPPVKLDVFAFGTHLTDLTPCFQRGDTDAMLLRANAAIDDFAGGTRIGSSLCELRRRHAHRFVAGRTIAALVTDGLETGKPEALNRELQWLKRRARRLLWLNPMMRFEGYAPVARGARVLSGHADAMLMVRDLNSLEQIAATLAEFFRGYRARACGRARRGQT